MVVCGYKGYWILVYFIATAICGYKGYWIFVYLIAMAVCGYKEYWISVYLSLTVVRPLILFRVVVRNKLLSSCNKVDEANRLATSCSNKSDIVCT